MKEETLCATLPHLNNNIKMIGGRNKGSENGKGGFFFLWMDQRHFIFFLSFASFFYPDAWDVLGLIPNSPSISLSSLCASGVKKVHKQSAKLQTTKSITLSPVLLFFFPPQENREAALWELQVALLAYLATVCPGALLSWCTCLANSFFSQSIFPCGWAGSHPATRVELLMPGEAERWFHCEFRCSGWMAFRGGWGDWRGGWRLCGE